MLLCSNVQCGDPKELCTDIVLVRSNIHCGDPKELCTG